MGVVQIQQQGKEKVLLHDVLFVPDAPHSIGLISIGKEQAKGATVTGEGNTLTLTLTLTVKRC
jgi:fatty acid/phospholipid biosynthesis enzyme